MGSSPCLPAQAPKVCRTEAYSVLKFLTDLIGVRRQSSMAQFKPKQFYVENSSICIYEDFSISE